MRPHWNVRFHMPKSSRVQSWTRDVNLTPEIIDRFHAKVATTPTASGCLLWLGYAGDNGRGLLFVGRRKFQATRVAYELACGQPPRRIVNQVCGNALCCAPAHLQAGAAAPRRRPNSNNRRSGVLHIHPAGNGWRGKQAIDGTHINTRVYRTIAEAAEALAKARAALGAA